ncbi:PREDICTED: sodium- and chloride-dependent glycine transporter 1-like, partial [Priapulus caudatus]|uniref:Sodium- and chloride-dependent glycine transporter 1-like n=1 Tax=Priapulus caudatus TaxID=37621 RepID=A0ABM1E0G2_PRICU
MDGIGTGMVTISGITCVYYNMIIAWTIFYTFASFNKVLPWSNCDFERSTLDCYDYNLARKCESGGGIFYKTYCFNATEATEYRVTKEMAANATKVFPSQEYFTNYVLDMTDGIEYMGKQRWQLVLCLLAAWVIVYLCLIKGVKSSGKVVYFTALFPYVVLTILLIRGATMPGAINGIRFYMIPDWSKLKHAKVWGDAAKQIFYSLGPAWGGLITLASYNKFNNNLYRDALIVSVGNCATSVFAGFAIFSILGFMAHDINVPVGEVVDSGPGLAFIAYPEAITRLPIAPLWSFLFFFMIITLGLDSQFTMMETVTTAVLDKFTQLRKYKAWVLLAACTLWFLAGLSMTGQVGVYVLTLIDSYAAGWSLMILALLECIVIGWFYDVPNVKSPRTRRFGDDIAMMIGYRPFIGWQIMWKFVTPAILLFILFFTWIDYTPIKYASYVYP